MDLIPSFIKIMALKINIVSNTLSINSLVLNPSETKIAVFEKNNTVNSRLYLEIPYHKDNLTAHYVLTRSDQKAFENVYLTNEKGACTKPYEESWKDIVKLSKPHTKMINQLRRSVGRHMKEYKNIKEQSRQRALERTSQRTASEKYEYSLG